MANATSPVIQINEGNVGIGTNSPAYKLDVNGEVRSDAYRIDLSATTQRALSSTGTDSLQVGDAGVNDIKFKNAAGNSVIIASSGKVGIGTTSPESKLHVNGSVGAYTSDYAAGSTGSRLLMKTFASTGNTYSLIQAQDLGGISNNVLALQPYGDNVGIGTTSADSKLHIDSTGEALRFTRSSQETYRLIHGTSGLYFTRPNSSSLAFGVTQNSDFDIFDTSANVMFRADASTGNVGIGTTSPSVKLDVDGNIKASQVGVTNIVTNRIVKFGGTYLDDSSITDNGSIVSFGSPIDVTGLATANAFRTDTSNNTDYNLFTRNSANNAVAYFQSANSSTNQPIAFFSYGSTTVAQGSHVLVVGKDKSYFDNTNVGIGTTSPSYQLEVNNTTNENLARFYRSNSATSISHLVSTGRPQTRYSYDGQQTWYVGNNLGTFGIGTGYLASTPPIFNITSTGNVGIGTTSPAANYKLHVAGGIKATNFLDFNNNYGVRCLNTSNSAVELIKLNSSNQLQIGSQQSNSNPTLISGSYITLEPTNFLGIPVEAVRVIDGGNVGIGTTSPSVKLDVDGNIKASQVGVTNIVTNRIVKFGGTYLDDSSITDNGSIVSFGSPIDVTGLATANAFRTDTSNNTDYNLFTRNSANNAVAYFQSANSSTNQPIAFFSYGSTTVAQGSHVLVVGKDKSYFDNTNVGIGTTNPSQKLHVAGNIELQSAWEIGSNDGSYWQRIRTEDSSVSTTNAFNFETRNGSGSFIKHMVIRNDGNVGIGVTNPSYALQVGGSIVGTSKNFIIDHPTKEGKKLLHACIEGPEAAVYFRGKSTSNIIEMPDYWIGLVDIDTMTVDITAIGPNQDIYVESIADNGEVTIASNTEETLNYFYVVYGERKDIGKLDIEVIDAEYSDESTD